MEPLLVENKNCIIIYETVAIHKKLHYINEFLVKFISIALFYMIREMIALDR